MARIFITDRTAAQRLIDDLRRSLRNATRTGGRYAAYAHDAATGAAVEISLQWSASTGPKERTPKK